MKINKGVILSLTGGIFVALGLGAMTVSAANKNLEINLENVIQHIVNIKITDSNGSLSGAATIGYVDNMVGIETDNFILSQTGENINVIEDSDSSNILGGSKNKIDGGQASTILGGESNENKGNTSTILGGKSNKINGGSDSTIVGGSGNELQGTASVIVGGNSNIVNGSYSAVLGNGSSVIGDNSVALGRNTKVNANNSFLWTDGSGETLDKDNVFVVKSEHGMVVNATGAHSLAQLTIGGPLVLHEVNDSGDVMCDASHKGVVKLVTGDNKVCFCSCDGNSYWHSLYGQGTCEGRCNHVNDSEHMPECGSSVTKQKISDNEWIFSGSCNQYSQPVKGYFVDMNGKVYWTCQTDAGKIAACSGFVN